MYNHYNYSVSVLSGVLYDIYFNKSANTAYKVKSSVATKPNPRAIYTNPDSIQIIIIMRN